MNPAFSKLSRSALCLSVRLSPEKYDALLRNGVCADKYGTLKAPLCKGSWHGVAVTEGLSCVEKFR